VRSKALSYTAMLLNLTHSTS